MSPCPPPLVPHEAIHMRHTHLLAPVHQIPACLISPTQTILPTYPPPLSSPSYASVEIPPITILSLFPFATCLSISRLHLSMPSPSAPSLSGKLTPVSIPLPQPLLPSPLTTSAAPPPPTFLALLPLTLLLPSSRESVPPSPRLPPTRPLPPHLSSAQSATPSPILPASPFPPRLSASSCSFPTHSTSSHSKSRPTAMPSTPEFPPPSPPPNVPPFCPPSSSFPS